MSKYYNIIAGVNGAGKTSLYSIIGDEYELGTRVNIDEIAKDLGHWKHSLTQIKAGRAAMALINGYIENETTFHYETTLPGVTITKLIKKAKQRGFRIRLFFIGVDDLSVALARVHKRIAMGGHGADDSVIEKRYRNINEHVKNILPLCDTAILYDNTLRFRQVAVIENGDAVDCDRELPGWFKAIYNK